ncbi:uncharacterized protein LOC127851007 [Dreissena polymorpha]|uniref:Uncharacterized protein n=1 Tax=Dreissena polymorpha TaxID=45954 RepID=A0A9D4DDH1_DREPO|nr:uncharacterized protein LOC127851007 [Dreissena polymorpha]KAH3742311.1 hypothetical protein DPMN_049051 [Dreissena polymorpha]
MVIHPLGEVSQALDVPASMERGYVNTKEDLMQLQRFKTQDKRLAGLGEQSMNLNFHGITWQEARARRHSAVSSREVIVEGVEGISGKAKGSAMATSISQPPPSVFGRTGSERTMKHIRAIDVQNIKKRAREKTEMTIKKLNKESVDWAASLRNGASTQTTTVKSSPKLERSISFSGHALKRSRSNLDRNLLESMSLVSRLQSNLTSKLPKWRTRSESSRNAVAPGRLERKGSIDELVTSRKPTERGRPGRILRSDAVILSSNNIGKDKGPSLSTLPDEFCVNHSTMDPSPTVEPLTLTLLPEEDDVFATGRSLVSRERSAVIEEWLETARTEERLPIPALPEEFSENQHRLATSTPRPKMTRSLSQTYLKVPGTRRLSWR